MRLAHASLLVCPDCQRDVAVTAIERQLGDQVIDGTLSCTGCSRRFAIAKGVPRFVDGEDYTRSFGLEWLLHARTQYDRDSGGNVSEERFFAETRWPRRLDRQLILEAGSGSGRFTEHAAATGATIVSVDRSQAVDANYSSNGAKSNVLIVQGDLYRMPVRTEAFDKVFCFGVIQHTPDVRKSFMTLVRHVRPGGSLVVDVYRKRGLLRRSLQTKRWVRPLTTRMAPLRLYRLCQWHVRTMWPLTGLIGRIPRVGRKINFQLLVADYRGVYPLSDAALKEWAVLDTFDMLSPAYDQPQTLQTMRAWCAEAGLVEADVMYGYNGIEVRAAKPDSSIAEACA